MSHVDKLHDLIHPDNQSETESQLACCGLERVNETVLKLGRLDRREALALAQEGSKLSIEAKERARILFANGEDMVWGKTYLFLSSFLSFLSSLLSLLSTR